MSKRKHIAMPGTLVTFIGLVLSGCTLESGEAGPEQDDVEKIVWNHQESGCNARDAYVELLELGVADESWEVYGGNIEDEEKKVTTILSRHRTSEETAEPVSVNLSKDGVEMRMMGNNIKSSEEWEVIVDGKPYSWISKLNRMGDITSCTYTVRNVEFFHSGDRHWIYTATYDRLSGKVDVILRTLRPIEGIHEKEITFTSYAEYLAGMKEEMTNYVTGEAPIFKEYVMDFLETGEDVFSQATSSTSNNLEEYGDSLPGGIWYMFRERMEGGN